ncbi:MAG: DEAD/DEAH box helicase [Proteobacteria bacterium]|nr:DEAD/DEAH box helicase [Pseudomonadota bacterium]
MHKTSIVTEYIQSLLASKRLGDQVVHHSRLPEHAPYLQKTKKPWPDAMQKVIQSAGIHGLYRHQADAIDSIRSGRHVVVATPTASGKTLVFNLPVLENILKNSTSKALYIFPLKALAQDQLRAFRELAAFAEQIKPGAEIYDGDTSAWRRKRIRETPPNVLLTNPEMIHLSLLPHHRLWADFFSSLEIVVIDEVHTYRGVMGSHMALVFRRLQRICTHYGAAPTFIFCSATVSNPDQLTQQLTGLQVKTITNNGAPRGARHIVFVNPVQSPAQTAILLLKAALHRNLRTIVYTQSRKLTELIAIWAGNQSGSFASRISAYRAGFLPEERREIEARLTSGDLLAVISTSALELGIDIGDLDLCLLVGYPGSVVATWQRGGRVGRSGQDSALIIIAGEDALDQYFMRNPKALIEREPEAAVVNPYNPEILPKHLRCAAAELPLATDDPLLAAEPVQTAILNLEAGGDLLRSADGTALYARQRAPHRHVDLRGTGSRFQIVSSETGESRGEIDGFRAFKETHPGAVYLHKGETFLVNTLDLGTATVKVSPAEVAYYTRVRSQKNTEILNIFEEKSVWGTVVSSGRLKVTDQVTGYEKWRIHAKTRISIIPLDLPPLIFETEGLWFRIPLTIQREAETGQLHFMGGIHAIEHAAIGIFPLLVMTDRNDLGGIAITFHIQTGGAAIFIYDGVPGGAGLTRQAFSHARELLALTYDVISTCACENGCPSCVHSPKCGSGNRPIDKAAAKFILEKMRMVQLYESSHLPDKVNDEAEPLPGRIKADYLSRGSFRRCGRLKKRARKRKRNVDLKNRPTPETRTKKTVYYGVFDVETQRSAQEVGGWHRAERMGISCAVLYDSKADTFFEFRDTEMPQFIEHLKRFELVVGFNIKRFDYRVLSGYSDFDFITLPTLDILEEIYNHLGYRLSLEHLARITLGAQKTADGLQALRWWKEGRIREIIDYCKADVAITRDLFTYGEKNRYLLFQNKSGNTVRIPVKW